MSNSVLIGDALTTLKTFDDPCVQAPSNICRHMAEDSSGLSKAVQGYCRCGVESRCFGGDRVPVTMVYVPLNAVFPEASDDFLSFCSLVRSLSRTDTIVWCARLNLILSNPQNRDEKGKQQYAVDQFFDAHEIGRLNRFMAEHANAARVFSREQLLELIRWTCLLAEDHSNDGQSFNDPETRRRFAQAALMASDIWGERVYRGGLASTGDQLKDRRRFMPVLRQGVPTAAPDVMRVLVRGDAIYGGAFQRG